MGELRVPNQLKPVGDRFHLANLAVVLPVQDTHCLDDHLLLSQVRACHELHQELTPENFCIKDLHG